MVRVVVIVVVVVPGTQIRDFWRIFESKYRNFKAAYNEPDPLHLKTQSQSQNNIEIRLKWPISDRFFYSFLLYFLIVVVLVPSKVNEAQKIKKKHIGKRKFWGWSGMVWGVSRGNFRNLGCFSLNFEKLKIQKLRVVRNTFKLKVC